MLLALALACGSKPVEFPDGLEPLEENTAPAPEGDGWPETLSVVSGDDGDLHWTHARGYVQVAAADVVAVVQDPEVGVDRRRVASFEVTPDTEPAYEVSYSVHTVVEDIVTVEYDLGWRHGAVGEDTWGTRWQKTDGDSLVELIEGSLVTLAVDDAATEVQFEYHLKAALTSTEDTESYLSDFYASVVAAAHGDPLPVWE